MEKFMTKEFAPGLALDTGELIPASDLNAQMTAPPVPTSATWGDWLEPTTVAQRLGDVLQLLCGGKRPPDDVVLAWLDAEMGDIGLQNFCAQHGPAWAQGIGLIELAMVAVAQPTDGVDHEQVEIEPQVELAYAPPRPVTPYTCPKCRALWLHWPSEQTGFGKDTLNCRSADHCHYCEKGGVEQLQRLERVPATLAAPQPSPAAQSCESDGWLHENGLLYRLTDERYPTNRDEINVTMADGSRSIESRSRRALELLNRIRRP